MKAQISQHVNDVQNDNFLINEAGGGLKFMGLQFNVKDKRRELQVKRIITPTEYYVLEEIESATIGARNRQHKICSRAEIYLEDIAERLGIAMNKVYVVLKSLQSKNLILRSPTRSTGLDNIGLNPGVFGQILIDSQDEKEKKSYLKLAVDNSRPPVDKVGNEVRPEDAPSPMPQSIKELIETALVPNQYKIEHKNPPLDPLEILDSSEGTGSVSHFSKAGSGNGIGFGRLAGRRITPTLTEPLTGDQLQKDLEETSREKARQVAMLEKMGVVTK